MEANLSIVKTGSSDNEREQLNRLLSYIAEELGSIKERLDALENPDPIFVE